MSRARRASLALAGLALSACGGADAPAKTPLVAPSSGAKDVASSSRLERYFPLVDGQLYHYVTTNDLGEQGLLVARVHRESETRGELRLPSGTRRFEYVPEGVLLVRSTGERVPLLVTPLLVGASWRGEHGGITSVAAIDVSVEVPAGRFFPCITTVEDRRGDVSARYATTFCEGVGITVLEVQSGANLEKAELKSVGPPVEIGDEGLRVVK
jgi:hypothetical protein